MGHQRKMPLSNFPQGEQQVYVVILMKSEQRFFNCVEERVTDDSTVWPA